MFALAGKQNKHSMKKIIKALLPLAAAAAICAAVCPGCGTPSGGVHSSAHGIPARLARDDEKIVVFAENRTAGFWASHGYSNGQMFNCEWSRDNAAIEGGVMNMSVTKGADGRYYGSEYRSSQKFGYGYYAVCMKAADCSGVISSFFTYTNGPWDEIDIEILGKDMTQVQFNYYTDGVGGHEYLYNLGFDASADFHEYAFDWREDSITWYVDGTAIYRATQNIPSHPQQIMMNVWNCKDHDEWSGRFDESSLPATAQYKWIAYSAA